MNNRRIYIRVLLESNGLLSHSIRLSLSSSRTPSYTVSLSFPFSVLVHSPLYPNLQRFSGDYSLPTPVLLGSSSRWRNEHIESNWRESVDWCRVIWSHEIKLKTKRTYHWLRNSALVECLARRGCTKAPRGTVLLFGRLEKPIITGSRRLFTHHEKTILIRMTILLLANDFVTFLLVFKHFREKTARHQPTILPLSRAMPLCCSPLWPLPVTI